MEIQKKRICFKKHWEKPKVLVLPTKFTASQCSDVNKPNPSDGNALDSYVSDCS